MHYLEPLVQLPPRGLWRRSGKAVLATATPWLGRGLDGDTAPDRLVLRYLAAFGPASVADVRNWSGLTGLREVIERLRPGLRTFATSTAASCSTCRTRRCPTPTPRRRRGSCPSTTTSSSAHDDRSRVGGEADRVRIGQSTIGWQPVLVDGFIRGVWRLTERRRAAVLRIEPTSRPTVAQSDALAAEGERLVDFLAPQATERTIQLVDPR